MRILCLGDSLTEGTVGSGFIPFLKESLPQHQYINLGANGDTIAGLRRRTEKLLQRGDVAVVWIGTNDVMTHVDWVENAPGAEEDYRLLLRAATKRTRTVITLPPLIASRDCASMYEYSLGRATEMAKRLSEEAACRFVDIQSAFSWRQDREYTIDGAHLNEAGAKLVAEVLAEHLRILPA